MSRFRNTFALLIVLILPASLAESQHSIARVWNEAHLAVIRHDAARPTVNARTLFHNAVAMYDAWAVYDTVATPYLLGKTVRGYTVPFQRITPPANIQAAREEAISYAAHRVLKHRFRNSPGASWSMPHLDSLFLALGYDTSFTSTDYSSGSAAALGNYIGQSVINYGLQDSSNEVNNYAYHHYFPYNPPMIVSQPGNPEIVDPNRWQPLTLSVYIDQNGIVYPGGTPKALTPEWGRVSPFALSPDDLIVRPRGGYNWWIYHDPGPPAMIDTLDLNAEESELYRWAFTLVAVWSSHHKGTDTVMVDISPASIGNNPSLPQTPAGLPGFYNLIEGGDYGPGRAINPRLNQPYLPNRVTRGDYTRVLTEFWADGPSSETPPGHWFTVLNYVNDHPLFVKKFKGQGPVLDDLEWDVKAYFALGGAVHDAGISAWGIKGWYDYVRPISAIRWMADRGQCTDSTLPRYSRSGIPLIPGFIELVQPGDQLALIDSNNINKIKLYCWRGPKRIQNPEIMSAEVGWILAEEWVPFQRPTFVTPPFPGYISGHSTFSRAAAELLTLFTGDEYFPGGMAEFHARRNEYLLVEEGPSTDVTLQWATYRDASDQCSLSRIWGGIHPPIDDMPGRLIGEKVGVDAFHHAELYFTGAIPSSVPSAFEVPQHYSLFQNYPNPFNPSTTIEYDLKESGHVRLTIYNPLGQSVQTIVNGFQSAGHQSITFDAARLAAGTYFYKLEAGGFVDVKKMLLVR